jgi:hypothetical protein
MSVLNDIKRNVMPVIEILYIQKMFVNKSRMRKGPGIAYDNMNISVVICDTYSVKVNQVMGATVKLSNLCIQIKK